MNHSKFPKFLSTLVSVFAFLVLFIGSSQAAQFEEGKHFIVIKGAAPSAKTITEYFSFYCPHCFRREPVIKELQGTVAKDVRFNKINVDSMPGRKIAMEHALTKALITANILKAKDKMIPAIFNYIHISHADFDTFKDIKNLFMINGVDGDTFDKTFSSFAVKREFNRMQNKTKFIRDQGITTVPTLIINGKFKPLERSIKSMDEYKALVTFLLNKQV